MPGCEPLLHLLPDGLLNRREGLEAAAGSYVAQRHTDAGQRGLLKMQLLPAVTASHQHCAALAPLVAQ